MFLHLLQYRWSQPPYNLPFEVTAQILCFLPLFSAAELGASQKLLAAIESKTQPPEFNPESLDIFLSHPNVFRMYLDKYRNRLKVLLSTESRHLQGAPVIVKIIYGDRVDLMKVLYEEEADWVNGFVHGMIRVAKQEGVEEMYQYLKLQAYFRNWDNWNGLK